MLYLLEIPKLTFKISSCAPLEFFLHFSGIAACTKHSSSTTFEKEHISSSNIDTSTFKSIFESSVFLGDSITDGLHDIDILDEKNIVSGIGKSIGDAQKNIEQVAMFLRNKDM
ncbi:hypothetical protein BM86_20605 [Bacillus thuringiensis]|nr:hypothetical protein [Bacillus thuringiensis]